MSDAAMKPVFTRNGLAAVAAAHGRGLSLKLTHLALGDGAYPIVDDNGLPLAAARARTALKNERVRAAFESGASASPNSVLMIGAVPAGKPEFWIGEIGLVDETGTLIAVWSGNGNNLGWRGGAADWRFQFALAWNDLPDDAIEIVFKSYRGDAALRTRFDGHIADPDAHGFARALKAAVGDLDTTTLRVSADDAAPGDLETKLLASGLAGLSTQNPGKTETRTIDVPVASQAQAEAGTDNTTAMTPLRVAQAVNALSAGLPAGCIVSSAARTPPDGYLPCNGAAISRTAYADLFTAIGTAFGAGDGSKTFNVPDLRGEFPRGWDNGRGVDGGRVLGSSQSWAIENITGTFDGNVDDGDAKKTGAFGDAHKQFAGANGAPGYGGLVDFDASRVVQTADETRPRNVALSFFIKY